MHKKILFLGVQAPGKDSSILVMTYPALQNMVSSFFSFFQDQKFGIFSLDLDPYFELDTNSDF